MRGAPLLAASLLLGACAKSPQTAASDPSGQPSRATESEATGDEDSSAEPPADVLYAAPAAVPPAGDHCRPGAPLPPRKDCREPREQLAAALLLEAEARDAALEPLEACEAFPVGIVRALRAELGPDDCADVLVEPVVGQDGSASDLSGDVKETLVALGLGARLNRLAGEPPAAPEDRDRESLQDYFNQDLFPWISRQAQAIFVMASQGTELSGYARGVVATGAGNADMRFVEIARAAPLAKEIAEHEEARDVYYATLDQRLEPRKARGRNAALVGLREMARLGVWRSERVSSARRLLSKVYGGRRVNALDTLLVMPLPPEKAEGAVLAIASRVPTPYAQSLVGAPPLQPRVVRAHMQMGMPTWLRREVASNGTPLARLLLARALFESGRTYFRAQDFQDVAALLASLLDEPDASARLSERDMQHARELRALSVALSAGPKDAAEMIAKGPRFADSLGNLAVLDALAGQSGEVGGRAAFNAAYLRELVAPEGAPDYWDDLGERYRKAAKKLTGDEQTRARERAEACHEIAAELEKVD